MNAGRKIFFEKIIYFKAFILGFTAMATQIILLREFLLVFYGNELVIGIMIALWMALTAFGVLSGKKFSINISVNMLLTILSGIPLLQALFIEVFRNSVFLFGRMPSLYETIIYFTLVLSIFCVPNGFIFSILNNQTPNPEKDFRRIYAFEALGSLVGGFTVSIIFLIFLSEDNFTGLLYILSINLFALGLIQLLLKKKAVAIIYLLFVISVVYFSFGFDLNRYAKSKLFKGQTIISTVETPLGNITVTGDRHQTVVYTNGQPVYSSEDFVDKEEDVHFAMLQRNNAERVLQIGGGLEGVTPEILKYTNVRQIVHIEMNKMFFDTVTKNKKVLQIEIDPIIFLSRDTTLFDVILLLEPPPENAQTNRFYTVGFFRNIKNKLSSGGVFALRLPASENYLGKDELLLHSVIYNSLHKIFKKVLIVPGRKNYFIASDDTITLQYSKLYKMAGIVNRYLNSDYIKDNLLQFRSNQIINQLQVNAPVNLGFKPTAYLLSMKHWLNYYGNSFQWLPIILGVILLFFLFLLKPTNLILFSTGFTAASIEMVILSVFQVLFGYLYLFLGIMVSVFMAGLAAGSLQKKIINKNSVANVLWLIASVVGIMIFIYTFKNTGSTVFLKSGMLFFLFVIAFFGGNQYRILVSGYKNANAVSVFYASDLMGAMLGGFFTVIWIIPQNGIYVTIWFNVILLFLTLIISILKKKISTLEH